MAFSVKSNKKSNKTGTTCYLHSKYPDSRTGKRTMFPFTNEAKAEDSLAALPGAFPVPESMQIGLPLLTRAASK